MTAAAAALLAFAPAPAAHAQGLFSFFGGGPSAYDIERRLDASGYALTGPLLRRGDVYLADVVVVGRHDAQRLVIDADTGRIVERYRVRPARWRDAPGAWDTDDGDIARLRPPADIDRPAPREEASRDENPAYGTGAPRTTGVDLLEQPDKAKPKPKPHEVKSKAVPLAKTPTLAPQTDASAGPAATSPVAAPPPAVTPSPPAAAAKNEAAPKSDAVPAPPKPGPSPSAVTAKVDPPAPPATPKSPPAAEPSDHKAAAKSKAVNDIPVSPLD